MASVPLPAPGPLSEVVGAILRARMARRNETIARLAPIAKVSEGHLSKMLRGQRRIDLEQLHSLCTHLELNPAAVMAEAAEELEVARERGQVDGSQVQVLSTELQRRALYIIEVIGRGDDVRTRASVAANHPEALELWDVLRSARPGIELPTVEHLETLEKLFGADVGYLNPSTPPDTAESRLRFIAAASEAGVRALAARTIAQLDPDEVDALAEALRDTNSDEF